ncbi:MAG: metallophosphoesterase [bacterium]|nr:metallophosphoesterase [bacterium]
MKYQFITLLLFSIALFYPLQPSMATVDSGITFGPYVQRITKKAATVLIRTNNEKQVTLNYQNNSGKWKKITDSTARTKHRYRITKLQPAHTYSYYLSIGDKRLTQTYTIRTEKEINKDNPLKIATVGDAGVLNTNSLQVAAQIQAWNPEMLLHTGDIAYNSGTLAEFTNNVFPVYQSVFANIPTYGTPGNHDYTTDQAGPYKDLFEIPKANSNTEDYYSFNYDFVHIVSVNSNVDYSIGSEMYNWLETDLQANQDKLWKIVILHHPPYSSGVHGNTIDTHYTLVPLFEDNDVNLVLAGHDHAYERSKKINDVLYIVTGGGGKSLYSQTHDTTNSNLYVADYHFTGLTVKKKKITIRAIDKNGYVFDKYILR